jgi:ADP-ribosylglycohydrolase
MSPLTLRYDEYLDRTWGCWLGKCVAGTIGAPYEGMKERMDMVYDPVLIADMLPNDDLDLQILWLDVLERRGEHLTAQDLAEAFFYRCPYSPGEYGVFKKNFARGLRPPATGAFSNPFYREGMGCPIRSEIWACVFPGNPEMAVAFAEKDGTLDHAGDSVYAEQFFAALEAAAFLEHDLRRLYEIGLEYVPQGTRIHSLITDTLDWCAAESDWRRVHARILRRYGHPDCTHLHPNIGFTLLALEFGGGSIVESSMLALNCGFDTDCTCATAGAILGLLQGGTAVLEDLKIPDQTYKCGVDVTRRSDRVLDLAEDTCRMGLHLTEALSPEVRISECPTLPPLDLIQAPALQFEVDVPGLPAIAPGEERLVTLALTNPNETRIDGVLTLTPPSSLVLDTDRFELSLAPGSTQEIDLELSMPEDLRVVPQANLVSARFRAAAPGIEDLEFSFGLPGAMLWQVYGPFWENCVHIPPLKAGQGYYGYLRGHSEDEIWDTIRDYHLNTTASTTRPFLMLDQLRSGAVPEDVIVETVPVYEDKVYVSDLIGFEGPCVVYVVQRIHVDEAREVNLQIGHTDAFLLWINGRPAAGSDQVEYWTPENIHSSHITLEKGENTLILRLTRRSETAAFSLAFVTGGPCSDQHVDLAWGNPEAQ